MAASGGEDCWQAAQGTCRGPASGSGSGAAEAGRAQGPSGSPLLLVLGGPAPACRG